MQNLRRAAVLGSSVLLAASSGYIMQNSDSLGQRPNLTGERKVASAIAPVRLSELRNIQPLMSIARPTPLGGALMLPIVPVRDIREQQIAPRLLPEENREPSGFDLADMAEDADLCAASGLALQEADHGLMRVDLVAPCHPKEVVRVSDGTLTFDILTDAGGNWAGMVPADAQHMEIKATFADGETSEAMFRLAAPPAYKRVALNWEGVGALRLNAVEDGAGAGVVATAPRAPNTPLGGYIVALGEIADGAMAEVYIAPQGMVDVQFDIEALVTEENCGADLNGRLIRGGIATTAAVTEFSFAMPDCSAVGTSLVMDLPEAPVALASAE